MQTVRRTISQVRIVSATSDRLIVSSGTFAQMAITVIVGLVLLLGIVAGMISWSQGEGVIAAAVMGGIFILPALAMAMAWTWAIKLTLDAQQKTLTVTREYLAGFGPWPRRREQSAGFSGIARVEYRHVLPGAYHNVELETKDGLYVTLQFGLHQEQAIQVVGKIRELLGPEAASTVQSVEAAQTLATTGTYDAMQREIRSWGFWSLGLGALHIATSGWLSAPWGILLVIVGLASFYFHEAAMFVIYAVTLGWAGISNLIYGQGAWKAFALLQAVFVFQILQQYRRFRRAQTERSLKVQVENPDRPLSERSTHIFPWAGAVLGSLSLTGLVLVLFSVFLLVAATESHAFSRTLGVIEGVAVDGAVLGLALGLAALFSGNRRKLVAITGCVLSGLTLLIELALGLIGSL